LTSVPITRLVQIIHPEFGRRTALVSGDELCLLATFRTVYDFALAAIETGQPLRDLLSTDLSGIVLDYREVHALRSGWRFLPSFDHPDEPSRCLVSGCANAHGSGAAGRPAAPPWFSKGNGIHLRAHGEPLTIPEYAASGAEEAEIAAVYLVAADGQPRRIGLTPGNEFADPAMAEQDVRLLSRAKLRTCSIGPELALDMDFRDVRGSVWVERGGAELWRKEIATGDEHTAFTAGEVEKYHFQFDAHRVPGDAHVHFLGGSVSSYGDGIRLEQGDAVAIEWEGFGRPLRNTIERTSKLSRSSH
jgi:hypothetical protein